MENVPLPLIKCLKQLLNAGKYHEDSFKRFQINKSNTMFINPLLPYQLADDLLLSMLFRLFYLGQRVASDEVSHFVKKEAIELFLRYRVFEKLTSNKIASTIMIVPYQNCHFASDFLVRYDEERHLNNYQPLSNSVYPVSADSAVLWNSVSKKKVRNTLDLCTGCGVHAILSSFWSENVIGIDINPRAIAFSNFNAQLNNRTNVTFIIGDLYNAINESLFDLILANPPSLITAGQKYMYRDGGTLGNKILSKVLDKLPSYLDRKGRCYIVSSFFETPSTKGKKRTIKKWLNKYPMNGLFLCLSEKSPIQYTASISQFALLHGFKQYNKEARFLLSQLNKLKVDRICFGISVFKHDNRFSFQEKQFLSFIPLNISIDQYINKWFQ